MNLNTVIQKKLEAGHYVVTVKDYENVENEKGGYLKVNLKFDDRDITDVVFPKSANYFFSCMRNQLDLETEDVSYADILNQLKGNNIDVWVYYNEFGRNIAYHKPAEQAEKIDAENINV